MAFDGITIANMVKEFQDTIVGGKINKIAQPEADELLITIKSNLEIYINGRIVGKGEVMVYEKNLAIRVNEVLDSNAIIYYLTRESISTT